MRVAAVEVQMRRESTQVAKETVVCENQNGFSKGLCKKLRRGQRKDYGLGKYVEWNIKLAKNVQEKRNLWLLWTEECRSANGTCPRMRVNSVGRGRRRGRRGVVGRLLRRRRWRKGWGSEDEERVVACSTRNITSGQRRGATAGRYGEFSQHVSRLQTVNAYCVSLSFPIDCVSFGTPTQNFPGTRPWCIEKVTFVFIRQHDVWTRE